MIKDLFLIDTNILLTPYENYYAFDLVPSFWKQLEQPFSSNIVVLDIVKDELFKGDDELTEWLNEDRNFNLVSHRSIDIITKYREIINYINDSPYYKPSAVTEWAKQGIADPWLIACAAVKGYVLVTMEKRSGNLSEQQPSKYAKIPDVADAFNVKTIGLFEMMRVLGIII